MDYDTLVKISLLLAITVFLLFVGGITVYLLWYSFSVQRKIDLSRGWKTVQGKIVSSQLVESVVRDSEGERRGLHLEVEYEYSVDGKPYINNKRSLGKIPKGVPNKKAQETASRYSVGTIIPVIYNPSDPQESCLERDAPYSNLVLILGLIMLFIFLCLCSMIGMTAWAYIRTEYLL